MVNFEAASKEILDLLKGEGKEFERMDPVVKTNFLKALFLLEEVERIEDLGAYRRFNLKFFSGQYQINITAEKRMRFTVEGDTVLVTFFGSTTHRGE